VPTVIDCQVWEVKTLVPIYLLKTGRIDLEDLAVRTVHAKLKIPVDTPIGVIRIRVPKEPPPFAHDEVFVVVDGWVELLVPV
jgi:hypothetical protein